MAFSQFYVFFRRERFRSFDGCAQGAVGDELRHDAEAARDPEEDGVERGLVEAVVRQQDAGVRVDVGVRVPGLAVLFQDRRRDVVDRGHEPVQVVLREALLRELALDRVARVGPAEHRVAVARDHLPGVERLPQVRPYHLLVVGVPPDLGFQPEQPLQDLLVRAAVQRAREPVHPRSERQVRRRQRAAHEVRGVRADVAALVVRVDREVQADQIVEVRSVAVAFALDPEGAAQVLAVVGGGVCRGHGGAVLEHVAVDLARDRRQLAQQVQRVLVRVLPVLRLGHPLQVRLREPGLALQRRHRDAELRHRVQVPRQRVQQLRHVCGQPRACRQVPRQRGYLLCRRAAPREQQPEQRLRLRLLCPACPGQLLPDLRDAEPAELDTFLGVQHTALPHHARDAAHPAQRLVHRDLAYHGAAVLPFKRPEALSLCRNASSVYLFKCRHYIYIFLVCMCVCTDYTNAT